MHNAHLLFVPVVTGIVAGIYRFEAVVQLIYDSVNRV